LRKEQKIDSSKI